MIVLMRVRMSIICSENGLLVCSHGPLELAQSVSIIYRRQGKIEEALRRCKIAWRIRLELFQAGKISEVLVGLGLHTLGTIYLDAGNILEADQRFREAFDIFLRANYKAGMAIIYNRFGQVQLLKGELKSAREQFVKAQEASREVDKEQYINSLNKQGRVCVLQDKWEEGVTFFEKAVEEAQSVPDYYQQTESLIDLADALQYLKEGERAQKLLQEAENIATKENYVFLLGLLEKSRGQIYYGTRDYQRAFEHFVLYCHHMADYNFSAFSTAIQKVVDVLLDIPKGEVPVIVKELLTYWTTHQLNEEYPELVQTFEEIDNLMVL